MWSEPVTIPTYLPELPDRFPAYLDQRVYQGSSGRVFPLPFHDRISERCAPHTWVGLHLENEYLRLLVLPELGGRIQYAVDRRTGYPLFYANTVIKPALVGLAGPWLAGGVEFNWPQHHRPATFLPVAWELEEATGTVWCSDHDPFARMKGMHGVRLHPGSTLIELDVRLYNRSDEPQTFLWWANVAAEVHDEYQSFFPADVTMVADHAKRAVTSFPAADRPYYGIDYSQRRALDTRSGSSLEVPGDRLDWPRNIPVPTSYMCIGSEGDFFGGYDHRAGAGFVHWADHRFVNGKKQWTWGDAPFGEAWNRNLADDGSAYIELMAGAFTENQPDFSFLAPGETKRFTQYWYPLAGTGPAVAATRQLALGVELGPERTAVRLDATQDLGSVSLVVEERDSGRVLATQQLHLSPQTRAALDLPASSAVTVRVVRGEDTLLEWSSPEPAEPMELHPAVEPPDPSGIATIEELYLTGRHLQQYRHATRSPEPYWAEALARDPGHSASHLALARLRLDEGRYAEAEPHLRVAIGRLTALNPNPEAGEPHYQLGVCLLGLERESEAYEAFAKAAWVEAWAAPANLQLALIDARRGEDGRALERVRAALAVRADHSRARNLLVLLLRRLGQGDAARQVLAETLALDPLDLWARHLAGVLVSDRSQHEAQSLLDVAVDYARAGELRVAVDLCAQAREEDARRPLGQTACGLLADYLGAWFLDRAGDVSGAARLRERASAGDRTWNFASRLDDVAALLAALKANPADATAAALLGHWCYAHGRQSEAVELWRRSASLDPTDPVVWRNLGVAAYNLDHDVEGALDAYRRAGEAAPDDSKLLRESDQLQARAGASVAERLARLERRVDLVAIRDDLCVAYAHLLVSAGRSDEALATLIGRRFQPWEGGEGQVLGAWERTRLSLADGCLRAGDPGSAIVHLEAALEPPESLGEARHPLASPAPLLLALGDAAAAAGDSSRARAAWAEAASATGDFAQMAPIEYSESTYYSILAAQRLGDTARAETLIAGLADHARKLALNPAKIDYFATSLPTLLLFHDDPARQQDRTRTVIEAQLAILSGRPDSAARLLEALLVERPGHEPAVDLVRDLQPVRSTR